MTGVYKITNPEGKIYIGQSKYIEVRLYSHRMKSSNKGLKKSIDTFGFENHKIEIVLECEVPELKTKETESILQHKKEGFILFNSDYKGQFSGRKKTNTIKRTISMHPSLIKEIRAYAKKRTQEELKKEQTKN